MCLINLYTLGPPVLDVRKWMNRSACKWRHPLFFCPTFFFLHDFLTSITIMTGMKLSFYFKCLKYNLIRVVMGLFFSIPEFKKNNEGTNNKNQNKQKSLYWTVKVSESDKTVNRFAWEPVYVNDCRCTMYTYNGTQCHSQYMVFLIYLFIFGMKTSSLSSNKSIKIFKKLSLRLSTGIYKIACKYNEKRMTDKATWSAHNRNRNKDQVVLNKLEF